jgi:hypothetical protein
MAIQRAVILDSGRTREIPFADTLDAGSGIDAASGYALGIGRTNATSVTVGRDGIDLVLDGTVNIGHTSADGIKFVGLIGTDITFDANASSRHLSAASTSGVAGVEVHVEGGPSSTNPGGKVLICGGSGVGTGGGVMIVGGLTVAAPVVVGTNSLYSTDVTIGASGVVTTIGGELDVNGLLCAKGDVDLGDATSDTISFVGFADTNLTFTCGSDRMIGVQQNPNGDGKYLVVYAGGTAAGTGGALYLYGGDSANGAGGSANIAGGNGTTTGGDVTIVGGSGSTVGYVYVGATSTKSVYLGAAGTDTYVSGGLGVTGSFNADGDVDLGNSTADTITLVGYVDSNLIFSNAATRYVYPAAKTGSAGAIMYVRGGGTTDANTGGILYLEGGASTSGSGASAILRGGAGATGGNVVLRGGDGTGTDGGAYVGDSYTSGVYLAATGITTLVYGPLTVSEAFTANGSVTLGNAGTDAVTVTGYVAGNVTFDNNGGHVIGAESAAAGTGVAVTLQAGDADAASAAGGATYVLGGDSNNATGGAGGTAYVTGGASTSGTGGHAYVRGGNSASGTDGTVYVGTSQTAAVSIGATTLTTTVNGNLTIAETLTANGTVTLGNANTDIVTVTGWLSPDANLVVLNAHRSNTTTSFADATGLSLAVPATGYYSFKAIVIFYTAATTTGIGLAMNGPSTSYLAYRTSIPTTGVQGTDAEMVEHVVAWDTGTATTGIDAANTRRVATIEGGFYASATGTLVVRFKSEVSTSAVYVTYGSRLDLWRA